jgi:alpha-mannosidase
VDQPNLVIETIKAAQDGEGLIIRLYESQRMRGGAILTAGFPIKQAWLSNIMEENQKSLNSSSNQVEFSYKPYQIITLRVEPE